MLYIHVPSRSHGDFSVDSVKQRRESSVSMVAAPSLLLAQPADSLCVFAGSMVTMNFDKGFCLTGALPRLRSMRSNFSKRWTPMPISSAMMKCHQAPHPRLADRRGLSTRARRQPGSHVWALSAVGTGLWFADGDGNGVLIPWLASPTALMMEEPP